MIEDRQIKLIIGSLLHDIGKVVYRSGDGREHSKSGAEYLEYEAGIKDQEILHCVKYHHGAYLKNAQIAQNDGAYVTYYADNVAAFTDRREAEEQEDGFDKTVPLASVFNILNGNQGRSHYAMQVLDPKKGINYPTEAETPLQSSFYQQVIKNITDNLKGIEINEEYLNSLLSVLEANLSYIPSSTSKRELTDISLYDHVKMTAAIASCVEQYLNAEKEMDYRKRLFVNAKNTYDEKMFLLFSMDISGIQKFIYSVGEKGALKGLRARSFYLEIMMEHIIDELLEQLSLSRANLIYSGGGHCYLLLPNTEKIIEKISQYEASVNAWLLKTFDTALYIAAGWAEASANALRNVPHGSYSALYLSISHMISEKKSHRYDAKMIRYLNSRGHAGERECRICRRAAKITEDVCEMCAALERMSGSILYDAYFSVTSEPETGALPLPGDMYLVADSKKQLMERMNTPSYVRSYTKNDIYTGKHVTTKLWVGDYTTGDTFESLAEQADGVKRIGILRADVDNLGTTFVYGFQRPDGEEKYMTLSRTATLSRQLSLFFKCYINKILEEGTTGIVSKHAARKAAIVYSGGDDIFLAGAWNDVMAAFIDIKEALERFTQGTLTISGGIGVYHPKYPLNVMAKEVEQLEDRAKNVDGKNAVTIMDDSQYYPWNVFLQNILSEKVQTLDAYFEQTDERGMAFLYHLLNLLRNTEEKINIARYVYLLSKMEPEGDVSKQQREQYRKFSRSMYEWSKDPENRRELITAIYIYVYLHRKEESEK